MSEVLDISVSSNGVLQIREDIGRRTLAPGSVVEGVWVDTNTSGEPQAVQAEAAVAWTPAVVAAYRAATEAKEPHYTAEELAAIAARKQRLADLSADALTVTAIDLLKNNTAAQIKTYMTNNVTTLAQARTVLTALTLALAYVLKDQV